MADPGYGPNGERVDVSGRLTLLAQGPILTIPEAEDVWTIYPLGVVPIPFVDQDDDTSPVFNYLGGVL